MLFTRSLTKPVSGLLMLVVLGYGNIASARYLSSDPIGLQGGLNTYTYVDNNPLRFIDPSGLYKWSGTMIEGSFIGGVGAGAAVMTLESECVNGKKAIVKIVGVGPGLGVGLKGVPKILKNLPEGQVGGVTFNDFRLSGPVDPSVFGGRYESAGAGIVIGGGFAHSKIRCGTAFASETGFTYGLNLGASAVSGSCTVLESRIEDCICKKEE